MPAERKIAFESDLAKARFIAKSADQRAFALGNYYRDDFDDSNDVDPALSSEWAFDAEEKCVQPSGTVMAVGVSKATTFSQNIVAPVTGIWEAEGTVRVFLSRNNGGTWTQLTNETAVTLTGATGKIMRLKVELDPGARLKGWSVSW